MNHCKDRHREDETARCGEKRIENDRVHMETRQKEKKQNIYAQCDLYKRRNVIAESFLHEDGRTDRDERNGGDEPLHEQRIQRRIWIGQDKSDDRPRECEQKKRRTYNIDDARRLFSENLFKHF